ncbi:MAG TPA: hypothetical protein VGE41_06975, partial [Verrucomicrobiae bacterium]
MKNLLLALAIGSICCSTFCAEPGKTLYENSFDKAELNKVPEDMLVLDGGFSVKEDAGNKFIELPGSPVAEPFFGDLFGPTEAVDLGASCRIFGTNKGRRYPIFGLGLNGVGGYKLQISPGKKQLELFKGEDRISGKDFEWTPNSWTQFRLEVKKSGAAID